MADDRLQPVADIEGVCRTLVQMLQAEPRRYYLFGCYWWAVKRMLKQHGYGAAQCYILGASTDPEAEAHLPVTTDDYLLAYAIEEQKARAFGNWGDPDCTYPDTGEPYHLFDEDAGF